MPHDHANHLCSYHEADETTVASAIDGALAAKAEWESMPWNDRAAIFLKAADLVSGKYRYKLMAATILGQGKNAWQAEIDAAAEVRHFLIYDNPVCGGVLIFMLARGFLALWCQVC
jgi:1-pyrroline-5-carboxylate dehydrogenase